MRYIATVANSQYLRDYTDKPCEQACVTAPPIDNAALALRHARAFAAVVRAAKALRRARRSDVNRVGPVAWGAAYGKATEAHDKAVDRLVAVENEVKRGQ